MAFMAALPYLLASAPALLGGLGQLASGLGVGAGARTRYARRQPVRRRAPARQRMPMYSAQMGIGSYMGMNMGKTQQRKELSFNPLALAGIAGGLGLAGYAGYKAYQAVTKPKATPVKKGLSIPRGFVKQRADAVDLSELAMRQVANYGKSAWQGQAIGDTGFSVWESPFIDTGDVTVLAMNNPATYDPNEFWRE